MAVESIAPFPRAVAMDAAIPVAAQLTPQARRLVEGPVLATLLRLAAPTVALMLLQGVVSAGETAFVGRLGASALAGVSLSFPLVMLMTTLSAGAYGGGVSSALARALGAGRIHDARQLVGTAVTMAAMLGLVFTAMMLIFGRAFYRALGASDDALDAALQYSNVLFLGSIPFWVFGASASILRGSGNANYPALVGAIGGFITLAVSPLLIFGAGPVPAFGIMGAASAVVAYNLIAALVLLRAISSKNSAAPLSVRALIPQWPYALAILKISVPSAANTLLTNLTFVLLTGLVAPYGTTATAGYGTGGRLEYLLIPIVFGIGSALVPLIAASDGAGNFTRVRRLTRTGALLGAGVCGLIGVAAALFPQGWMAIFTDDAAVTKVGVAYLLRVGPAYAFLGLGLALYFAAQGRGRTTQPLLASLTRLLIAGIGGTLVIGYFGWGLDTLFTLMAAGLVLYGLVMVFVMRKELGRCALRENLSGQPQSPGGHKSHIVNLPR